MERTAPGKADAERAAAEATAEKVNVERAAAEATTEKAYVERAAAEATAEKADVERAAAEATAEKANMERAATEATAEKVNVERAAAAGTQDKVEMALAADTQDEDGEMERHLVNKVKRKHQRTLPGPAQANIDIAPIFEGTDLYTSITRARFEELCPDRHQDTLKIALISVSDSVSKPKFDNLFGCRVTITEITSITLLYTSITRARFDELRHDQSTDLERATAEKADVERAAAEKADVDEVKIASAANTQDKDKKPAAKDATPAAGTQDNEDPVGT